jgi:hypothetical protein
MSRSYLAQILYKNSPHFPGLDWNPLLASWTKKKKVKQDDAVKIRRLFEDNFAELYKWWSITLNLVMEVIQVQILLIFSYRVIILLTFYNACW